MQPRGPYEKIVRRLGEAKAEAVQLENKGKKMRGNKKWLAGLLSSLLCILTLLLSACGGDNTSNQSTTKAPDSQQIFRYPTAVESDFQPIDPALVQSESEIYALQLVFTGLVQFDNNRNIKDQLAQSHEISQDGLTYTFHLKPNLKFSDRSPLTAQDVAYSINRVLLPETKSPVTSYLKLLKGYDDIISGKVPTLIGTSLIVKDESTISILISQPAAYFLSALTYPTSYVVQKSLIDRYGTTWTDHLDEGGGAGPFKVKRYIHSKTFDVVVNPNYYGPKPALKEIHMAFSGDTATTYKAYKNHQYDLAPVLGADLQEAEKRSDFYRGPGLSSDYVSFNFLAKPFNNREIRQAFALAVNKEIIARNIAHNAVTATNHIVPEGMFGYNPNLKGPDGTTKLTGNQAKAKTLLAKGLQEEGYSRPTSLPPLTLTSYQGNVTFTDVVNSVVDQWKTVLGVDVKVSLIDFNTLAAQQNATTGNDSLQMWAYDWQTDYPDPQDWLSTFFGKGQSYNNNNYGDNHNQRAAEEQAIQDVLSKADAELDSVKRLSLYNDAEQKLVNDIAWVPLSQSSILVVQNPKLHGYKTDAFLSIAPDSWKDVYFTM